jgi:hypothetical protein
MWMCIDQWVSHIVQLHSKIQSVEAIVLMFICMHWGYKAITISTIMGQKEFA